MPDSLTALYRHWFITHLTSAQLEEVKSNIDRALAIAPDLPDAHLALGIFYYWGRRDYDSALRELDRAIELQPNNSDSASSVRDLPSPRRMATLPC